MARVWNEYGERMYVTQAHVCGTHARVALVPRYSYVTNVFVYNLCITVCVCMKSYVTGMYSYVARMYSNVTRMLLVCTPMLLIRYSYVLVWCLSHDPSDALFRKQRQIFRYSLAFLFIF